MLATTRARTSTTDYPLSKGSPQKTLFCVGISTFSITTKARLQDGVEDPQNLPAGSQMLGILYPRAGNLGGCGSQNALITIYPHDSDWDNIASLTGDNSWSASNNMRT